MSQGEITKRAGQVGLLTLLSRIAGLIRDVAIAYAFGARSTADAFFVAFRIPNLLRRLFAEGALTVSFVPIFTQTLKNNPQEAKRLSDATWTLLALILALLSVFGILTAPWLVKMIAFGFVEEKEKYELTVYLTKIIFPYIILVSLAAWAMGVLNSLKHFAAPAASSIMLNVGIIGGALGLSKIVDPPVLGLALGVLIGGVLQLGIHLPFLKRQGFFPKIHWNPSHPGVKKIVGMMIPAAFGAAVYQFNVVIITLLASFLPTGSVSYLWYADRVMEFPLGVWGIAMATVLLPSLSDHVASGDTEKLKETFRYGLKMVFFMTIPAAGGLIMLSEPIIRLIFEYGSFTDADTLRTAHALVFFSLGLPFIAGVRVTSNGFFSLQDSKTPVKIAVWSVAINLALCAFLMRPMLHSGLALAISLSAFFNFFMQLWAFRIKIGSLGLKNIFGGVVKALVGTFVMMVVLRLFMDPILGLGAGGGWRYLLSVILLIAVGKVAFFTSQLLLKSEEFQEVLNLLKSHNLLRK